MAGDPMMRTVLEQLAVLDRSLDVRVPLGRPPTMPSDPAAAAAYADVIRALFQLQRSVEAYTLITGRRTGRPRIVIGFGDPTPRSGLSASERSSHRGDRCGIKGEVKFFNHDRLSQIEARQLEYDFDFDSRLQKLEAALPAAAIRPRDV